MKKFMKHLGILLIGIGALGLLGCGGYLISLISMKALGITLLVVIGLMLAYAVGLIIVDSIP